MNFIWLPESRYPDCIRSRFNTNLPGSPDERYAVAEFRREYRFRKIPKSVVVTVTGEAQFFLYANGAFVGLGPVSAGGDFLCERPLPWAFENRYELPGGAATYSFRALVRLQPDPLTEYTHERGAFSLRGRAIFEDGEETFETDEGWLCRVAREYPARNAYDDTLPKDEWICAARVPFDARLLDANIPMLDFDEVCAREGGAFCAKPGDDILLDFDRVYAAYVLVRSDAALRLSVTTGEDERSLRDTQRVVFGAGGAYMSLRMFSVGCARVRVEDCAPGANVDIRLLSSHYPFGRRCGFRTDDEGLDLVMDVCRHTLGICRQTEHLDSPKHQELLACTGDYYIEMLMTAFENGDLRLADADVRRTAMWLWENDGRMFHTSYSLIWVQMVKKLYDFTANADTVRFCVPALQRLLCRFESYLGENGVIENPPDYMFVDWTVLNGYSMHHPPKALGQTVLNAFYYRALVTAAELLRIAGLSGDEPAARAARLKEAFHRCFWHPGKRMYADGLATPERNPGKWLPENPDMVHFSRYPQALAALYGLADGEERARLAELAADEENELPPVQPYFMHFVLEAVIENGLTGKYAMKLIRKWVPLAEGCRKGLQEGWIKPEEGYSFDHSHAWGGTPAYHLPLILSGLTIVEPGYRAVSLKPCLWGLSEADFGIPTPFGEIRLSLRKGQKARVVCPPGIRLTVAE